MTAVSSGTSPTFEDANLIELPPVRLTAPKWPFQPPPVWARDIPTILGDSIHAPSAGRRKPAEPAVEIKDQHKPKVNANSSRIKYPVLPYNSCKELDDAARAYRGEVGWEAKIPEYFQHGIQFNPPPGSWNVFRTVVISKLTQSATMTQVLDKIRGGVVVDAKLLNTFSITGGKTALVTFLHEQSATAFQVYSKQHPITVENRIAHVTVLKTPTWPISRVCEKALFDGESTRCLDVGNYPRHISPRDLRRHLRLCNVMTYDRTEYMNLRDDGVLALRFESIAYATDARRVLTSHSAFRGCAVQFAPDPCAQSS